VVGVTAEASTATCSRRHRFVAWFSCCTSHHRFNVGTLFALTAALLLAVALMSVRWLGATEPIAANSVLLLPVVHRDGIPSQRSMAFGPGTGVDLLA